MDSGIIQDIVQNHKPSDKDYYAEFFEPKMYRSICIPSMVHSYSLAIEYMKNWFLTRIPNYYKSTYINGSHLSIEYNAFNIAQKKEKPMLGILPEIDTEYDRDGLDKYLLPNSFLPFGHNANLNNIFYIDTENNIKLGVGFEQLAMNFTFRSRVTTKANQLDLWKLMDIALRVGANQSEFINADLHIPEEIIFNIADLAGFELVYKDNKPVRIKMIHEFMRYVNKRSCLPIIYKFRSITGNSEFFVRVPNILMHITSADKVQLDDGEMEGKIRKNFNLDYQCRLLMTIPKYFFMFYDRPINIMIPKIEADVLGILNMKLVTLPDIDDNGWQRFLTTQYQEDSIPDKYPHRIGIYELLESDAILTTLKYCKENGLSPSIFLKIIFLNDEGPLQISMDWDKYEILVLDEMKSINSYIAIYKDNEFINMTNIQEKKMESERIN